MSHKDSSRFKDMMPRFVDLISVIIPVYNAEPYLERCLNSVLNQDYPNTEIVLVNDGSTDGSLSICENYAMRNPDKFRILNQCNTGASIARKNGIEVSKGEFLMFVDSDDYVSPHYVSALYDALTKAHANIALCPMKRIDAGESQTFSNIYHTRVMTEDELFLRFFKYEFWGFGGGIYRRENYKGIKFPQATVNEDYFVKAQMFVNEDSFGYVEEPLYCYEQHPGSLSKQPLSLRALGEFDNAIATWEYIKTNKPKYSNRALAIASEAACKWLGALNRCDMDDKRIFSEYLNSIRRFLKQHLFRIVLNPHLLWKIKIVLIKELVRQNK